MRRRQRDVASNVTINDVKILIAAFNRKGEIL